VPNRETRGGKKVKRRKTGEFLKWDKEHIIHGRWPIGENNDIVTQKSQQDTF